MSARRAASARRSAGELPAEVDGVLDRGAVAEAARRREEVRGVSAEQDAPAPEALGDERVARRPGVAREDRRVDAGAGGGVEQARGVARLLAVAQLRVERELALAVDGGHERPAVAVEGDVHPGRRVRHRVVELR
jgi:hypothetical protein